ncbi:MAG: NAD(P)H-binding protein [Candidatus Obscuribacterales bacterium]|nr:NAD(P)H-binding protein [Candidatus Obscuribacterales bacterium]
MITGPVVVDGATGYVGSSLVHKLGKLGVVVHCLVHPQAKAEDIAFLRSCGAKIFQCQLNDETGVLKQALAGAKSVVHLIGSVAPRAGESLEDLHEGQTKHLLEAMKANNVKKLVMVTTLGASQQARSAYQLSKWQQEKTVCDSDLDYVILRPALILGKIAGKRDSKLIARYRKLILSRKSVPLIDGGKNMLQPIFIGDLIEAICISLEDSFAVRKILELGGPQPVSLRDVVAGLMTELGLNKNLTTVPSWLASLAGSVLEKVQKVPLVSRDQVLLSTQDTVCTENALLTVFGIRGRTLKEALSSYSKSESLN